jgi:hypothetical protein
MSWRGLIHHAKDHTMASRQRLRLSINHLGYTIDATGYLGLGTILAIVALEAAIRIFGN